MVKKTYLCNMAWIWYWAGPTNIRWCLKYILTWQHAGRWVVIWRRISQQKNLYFWQIVVGDAITVMVVVIWRSINQVGTLISLTTFRSGSEFHNSEYGGLHIRVKMAPWDKILAKTRNVDESGFRKSWVRFTSKYAIICAYLGSL